jgi:hypothetical protein
LGDAFADASTAAGDERGAIAKWHAGSWGLGCGKYNEFFEISAGESAKKDWA